MSILAISAVVVQREVIGRSQITAEQRLLLARLCRDSNARVVAELGAFCGLGSTRVLANAVGSNGLVVSVDTMQASMAAHGAGNLSHMEVLFSNLVGQRLLDRVYLIRSTSVEATRLFRPSSFDLVFVDAAHDEASVRDDIRAWKPLIRAGGILCGHDYVSSAPGVQRAVDSLLRQRQVEEKVWWTFV